MRTITSKTATGKALATKPINAGYRSEAITCFIMIALPLIGFVVFHIYPILWTFKWAFYNYNRIPSQTRFIGFDNFIRFFTIDFTYWKVWGNTLLFTALKLPIELPLSMGIALILNGKTKFKGFFRSAFYLPNIISTVVVGLIFSNMFSINGLVNTILRSLGIISENIDWFSTKGTAMGMLVAGSVWCSFGLNIMYFLAALSNVPHELYESAYLDGASKWTQFYKITLPMISPVFSVILMLSIIGTLGTNEYILAFTNGGPAGETLTVMSYLTQKFLPGFTDSATPALGYGCAMALITTIIFTFVGISYDKISKKINYWM